ncbi:hypothetical protein TNCT_175541 [Trichonephila clavata]|uniref:phosphoribosylformylglycinamidine cyclo-ligase n=1 Tax=Trichonephila clavata TaxID=2740835 RepID=A0A8X6G655_TRICU|nr:hypothetical protein TNCT_175541 [Trichonephila clavata]
MNTYIRSGIDLELYNKLIKEVKPIAQETTREEVISEIGSFSALFDFAALRFVVGVVDRKQILPNCSMMKVGDYIVGLESSGIHSNGFSLVRHIFKGLGINYNDSSPWNNQLWKEVLLEPTKIYVDSLLPIMPK